MTEAGFRRNAVKPSRLEGEKNMSRDWDTIRNIPIFQGVDEQTLRLILRNCYPRQYNRGDIIFRQGELANEFYIVLEGWAKLYRVLPEGEEVVVAVFTAKETFAEAVMFVGGRYPASAEAVSPARIMRVDGMALRSAIMQQPKIAFDILAATSSHLKRLVDQIEQLQVRSATERVADFLLRYVSVTKGHASIVLPYEKSLIASKLGMKPESFSRALARLRNIGVEVRRDEVLIKDVQRLGVLAEFSSDDNKRLM